VNFEGSSCTKFQIFRGSALDPAGGAYNALPDPLAGGEGARFPPPKNPTPARVSALLASDFGPLSRSFVLLPVREKFLPLKINSDRRHWLYKNTRVDSAWLDPQADL